MKDFADTRFAIIEKSGSVEICDAEDQLFDLSRNCNSLLKDIHKTFPNVKLTRKILESERKTEKLQKRYQVVSRP